MTSSSPFTCVLDARASLGECPLWSVAEQVLYWVDINAPSLNRFDPVTGESRAMPMPASIGSFVFRAGGGFVVALRSGIWLADLAPLQDENLVAQTVASAIGVGEETERPLVATLTDALRVTRAPVVGSAAPSSHIRAKLSGHESHTGCRR